MIPSWWLLMWQLSGTIMTGSYMYRHQVPTGDVPLPIPSLLFAATFTTKDTTVESESVNGSTSFTPITCVSLSLSRRWFSLSLPFCWTLTALCKRGAWPSLYNRIASTRLSARNRIRRSLPMTSNGISYSVSRSCSKFSTAERLLKHSTNGANNPVIVMCEC